MSKIKKYIGRENLNNMMKILSFIPDKQYLELMYRVRMGKKLDLKNPQTFNEKLQWLKLYDRKPEYTMMVDKYEAKKYVADKIGNEYIIPTLGIWDSFDEIDFDVLPNQFVLKCTHDSGGLVICRDKKQFDKEAAREKIEKSLKSNFFWVGREWPYKNVKPRIIAEKYMEDTETKDLRDYKFFCFGGVAKCYKVDFDRFVEHHANYYNVDGTILDFGEAAYPPNPKKKLDIKETVIKKMEKFATELAKDTPFLRADFYDVDGKVYFGEMTFYPASGFGKFTSDEGDEMMGKWIPVGGGYIRLSKKYVVYLHTKQSVGLRDYKVYCFNGIAKFLYLSEGMEEHTTAKVSYVNLDWTPAEFRRSDYQEFDSLPPKPEQLEGIIKLAEVLAKGLNFIRADFYEINNRIYFGEMTFFPGAGFTPFISEMDDLRMGKLLKLPLEKGNKN